MKPSKCFQQLSNEKMGELLKENTETLLFDLTVMSLVGTPFGPIEAGFHFVVKMLDSHWLDFGSRTHLRSENYELSLSPTIC